MNTTIHGQIKEKQLYSNFLGKLIDLLVYLPPNYSPLYSYEVAIAQDGKDYFQLGKIVRQVEELLSENTINDVIIIGIPYASVEERRELYHPKGDLHEKYLRFLAEELVPFIDTNYQTNPLAPGRTLIGDSLGGTVSLLAMLAYPHTFGQAIIQSPFVNKEILTEVRSASLPSHTIYHSIGTEETAVKTTNGREVNFLTANRELQPLLQKRLGSYHYTEFEGDHFWKYWQPDLTKALQWMFACTKNK